MNGIVFLIDGSDIQRLKIVKDLVDSLDKELDIKMPIVFLVNKQDVEGCISKNKMREYIDLDRLKSNFIWTIKYLL